MKGERLDERVLREGLAESRSAARGLILAGRVLVADEPVDKAGTLIPPDKAVRLRSGTRSFVSRGGDKLAAALALPRCRRLDGWIHGLSAAGGSDACRRPRRGQGADAFPAATR